MILKEIFGKTLIIIGKYCIFAGSFEVKCFKSIRIRQNNIYNNTINFKN
jgi:hypothetical protein